MNDMVKNLIMDAVLKGYNRGHYDASKLRDMETMALSATSEQKRLDLLVAYRTKAFETIVTTAAALIVKELSK